MQQPPTPPRARGSSPVAGAPAAKKPARPANLTCPAIPRPSARSPRALPPLPSVGQGRLGLLASPPPRLPLSIKSPPAHQPPVAEAHPTPPTPPPAPSETASVPPERAAAAVRPGRSCPRTASRKESGRRRLNLEEGGGASPARGASGSGYQPQLRQSGSQTRQSPRLPRRNQRHF